MASQELEEIVVPAWDHDKFAESLMEKFHGNPPYQEIVELLKYTDGSILPRLKISVKGKRVYVVASPRSGDSSEVKRDQLYHMFKATGLVAKENGAKEIIGVMAEHFYARSHREKDGECVFVRQITRELNAAGFDKILTLAIHSNHLYNFYKEVYKVDDGKKILHSLDPTPIQVHLLLNLLKTFNLEDKKLLIATLDEGANTWADSHKKWLESSCLENSDIGYVCFNKHRLKMNDAKNVETKLVDKEKHFDNTILFIPDDMGDTFGTLYKSLKVLVDSKQGMPEYVIAAFPHALINKTAPKIIDALDINLIASTSNPTRRTKPEISELPIFWYDPVNYFFEAIEKCIRKGKTLEEVFTPKNYPLWHVQGLYEIAQGPREIRKFTPDLSAEAFL
jgi:phosphoribosylpyrophosphate synthetase